jgi:DNA-binding transcriptional MerR regulator
VEDEEMYDMKRAVQLTQLNERSIRRYIKRFNLELKRGAYNSYVFGDTDIKKLIVIRTMLKESRSDEEIKAELEKIERGETSSIDISEAPINNQAASGDNLSLVKVSQEIKSFQKAVVDLKDVMSEGMKNIYENIENIERNLGDQLTKSDIKLDKIEEVITQQKEKLTEQEQLLKAQEELIEKQEKFMKMQIQQNLELLKKVNQLEETVEKKSFLGWLNQLLFGKKKIST